MLLSFALSTFDHYTTESAIKKTQLSLRRNQQLRHV
jgi:hypothetical protein